MSKKNKKFDQKKIINNLNIIQEKKYSKSIKVKRYFNKKMIIIVFSILGVIFIGATTGASSYLVSNSFSQKEEGPPPIIDYQSIANFLANSNSNLTISNDSNLKTKRPSQIINSDLTVSSLGINISGINDLDINLISFKIIDNSSNDIAGTLKINLIYNNYLGSTEINLFGFSVKPSIQIILQPQASINVDKGSSIILRTDGFIDNTSSANISYSWSFFNKNTNRWTDLTNSSFFSGVNTKNLTISNIRLSDATKYRCKLTAEDVDLYSNESVITVNDILIPIVTQIVNQNTNISITDSTLTNLYATALTVSMLNTNNVSLNLNNILNVDISKITFNKVLNANDSNGTIQLYIEYDGQLSVFPITLSGFKIKPIIKYVTVNQINSGSNSLSQYINNLSSNINNYIVNDFSNFFTIKDLLTNKTINFNDAISVVKKTVSSSDTRYSIRIELGLQANYATSSSLVFSIPATVNESLYVGTNINNNMNNYDLGPEYGNLVYVDGKIAHMNKNGISTILNLSTLLKLIDNSFVEYNSANLVNVTKIIQNTKQKNILYFLTDYSRIPFQTESGSRVDFSVINEVTFQKNSSVPIVKTLINLDRQKRYDPVKYDYNFSNNFFYSSQSNNLFILPKEIKGNFVNVINVDLNSNAYTISSNNIATNLLIKDNSPPNDGTFNEFIIKDCNLYLLDTLADSSIPNVYNEMLVIIFIKKNDSSNQIFLSANKIFGYDTSKKIFITKYESTILVDSRFSNRYDNENDNIFFIKPINEDQKYSNNIPIVFYSFQKNFLGISQGNILTSVSTNDFTFSRNENATLKLVNGSPGIVLNQNGDLFIIGQGMNNNSTANINSNSVMKYAIYSDSTFSSVIEFNDIYNKSIYTSGEFITSIFVSDTNKFVAISNFRNRYIFNLNNITTNGLVKTLIPGDTI